MKTLLALLLTASFAVAQTVSPAARDGSNITDPANWKTELDYLSPSDILTGGGTITPKSSGDLDFNNLGGGSSATDPIVPSGLVSDAKRFSDGVVSGTSLSRALSTFSVADTGKTVRIEGAGTAATATLTQSGGVINGYSITNAGSSGGYVPNDTFLGTVTDGSGTGAIVRAVTNSSGQVSSIVIDSGGTGYVSPTITFPSADHITTMTYASATAVTLAAAAPTAIGSNAVFFYGTDNTTAIQTAIDSANSSDDQSTVLIPNGSYLCNVRMKKGVTLMGAHSNHTQDPQPSDLSFNANASAKTGVQLVGLTREPVIDADLSYGADYSVSQSILSNIAVTGSTSKRGFGIRYGIANGTQVGYVGAQFMLDRVFISGFEYGFSVNRVSNFTVQHCEITGCSYGYNFGGSALISSAGGTDGINLVASAAHGNTVTVRYNNSKNATLSDCDFGGSTGDFVQNYAIVTEASVLTINSVNVERCELEIIRKTNGILTINSINCLTSTNAVLVSEYGSNSMTTINNQVGTLLTWGVAQGLGVLWRGTSAITSWPTIPQSVSGVMQKYSTTAWVTLLEVQRVKDYFATNGELMEKPLVSDRFTRITGSPYGEMGWIITGISGSFIASAGTSALRIASSADTSTNVGRLALDNSPVPLTSEYQSKFYFKDESSYTRNSKMRVGIYTLTSSFTPADGFGFRYDPSPIADESLVNGNTYIIISAGDTVWTDYGASANTAGTVFVKSGGTPSGTGTAGLANLYLETINNSVVTETDTGLLGGSIGAYQWLILQKTSQGYYGTVKNSSNVPLGTWNVGGTFRAVDASPMFIVGATATQWLSFQASGFTFRNL